VEPLAVLVLLALLAALFLPWLQSQRELSRAVQCRQRLHRIGLAIAQYESTFQCFPPASAGWYQNWIALILPALGRHDLTVPVLVIPSRPTNDELLAFERRLGRELLEEFRCPSESAPPSHQGGASKINYVGNAGSGFQAYGFNGFFRPLEEPIAYERRGIVRAADIVDGLSNTACVSEALSGVPELHRLRTIWETPRLLHQPIQLDEFAGLCASVPHRAEAYGWQGSRGSRGTPWFSGSVPGTLYNHVLPPNRPSCSNAGLVQQGAYNATSLHRRGCHLLYADGRVGFINDAIDLKVWRETGSRVGHDLRW
jgi:hypothetical protein